VFANLFLGAYPLGESATGNGLSWKRLWYLLFPMAVLLPEFDGKPSIILKEHTSQCEAYYDVQGGTTALGYADISTEPLPFPDAHSRW